MKQNVPFAVKVNLLCINLLAT